MKLDMERIKKYINYKHITFLKKKLYDINDYEKANLILKEISGINYFFANQTSFILFKSKLDEKHVYVRDIDRREYGDFQTPDELTDLICSFIKENNFSPKSIIEPTFGKGSFIVSSLKYFNSIKYIFGIEIYEKYVWETKFKILEYFLNNAERNKPEIFLYKEDIFKFDFNKILEKILEPILILGNPPWITNAELSYLKSNNLPKKSNMKNLKGLDAITGKGNFDIGEYISLLVLKYFGQTNGQMAFLIKNSVIKNLVQDLHKFNFPISNIKSYKINAKQYFDASVDASLFTCILNKKEQNVICDSYSNINDRNVKTTFGWYNNKFIANINLYKNVSKYDGYSPFEWRQGVKHDASKIFELVWKNEYYENGFHEKVFIENDLVYGLIKSSDLKLQIINNPRKYVIITQHYVGEDTDYINEKYPKLYSYLNNYKDIINNRKSSIYKNKPPFSIFGIGEYSFKPYKIAISGLYKKPFFSLILPENNKPLMLDDTCYFLSFDDLEKAIFTWCILTDEKTIELINSLAFIDSKRPFTKEILMRISIDKIAMDTTFNKIIAKINNLNIPDLPNISYESWEKYLSSFAVFKEENSQLNLFSWKG